MSTVKTKDVKASGLPTRRSSSTWRDVRAFALRSSWRQRGLVLAAGAAAGAVLSLPLGFPPLVGAGVVLGLVILLGLALMSPRGTKVALAIVLFLPFAASLGFLYTSISLGISPYVGDVAGGTITLLSLIAVVSVIAWKFSRGAPWVTVALSEVSVVFPGLFLLYLFPPMGLWAAFLSVVPVLFFRCGGWAFLVSSLMLTRQREVLLPSDKFPVAIPDGCAVVSLSRCPDGFMMVGPGGVFGVAVASASGPASETSKSGLVVPGVDVGSVAVTAVRAARLAARLSSTPERLVPALIVVLGEANAKVDRVMGVFVGRDGNGLSPDAAVRVVGGEQAKMVVESGRWRNSRVRRVAFLAARRNSRRRLR